METTFEKAKHKYSQLCKLSEEETNIQKVLSDNNKADQLPRMEVHLLRERLQQIDEERKKFYPTSTAEAQIMSDISRNIAESEEYSIDEEVLYCKKPHKIVGIDYKDSSYALLNEKYGYLVKCDFDSQHLSKIVKEEEKS